MSLHQARLTGFFAMLFLLFGAGSILGTLLLTGAPMVVMWVCAAGFLLLAAGFWTMWILN